DDSGAAAGRLIGLSESQIANAIAMAATSDASFAVVRAKPLSQWKGLASAQSALGLMNTLFLARRGVQERRRPMKNSRAKFQKEIPAKGANALRIHRRSS